MEIQSILTEVSLKIFEMLFSVPNKVLSLFAGVGVEVFMVQNVVLVDRLPPL